MAMKEKNRLDQALLLRGLARDLKEAQALIMAGEARVNGQKADRPDIRVAVSDALAIQRNRPFVSRGAAKIEKAVRDFAIRVPGLKVLDVGISTGGFSDFLLQHGAGEVLGVDVTISQVDSGLRRDPRLRLLEKNARFLRREDVPFVPDLVVMDLSFISITAVLPVLAAFPEASVLALVKPQFEAARGKVGKGGVVRDPAERQATVDKVTAFARDHGFTVVGTTESPVVGPAGNVEFLGLLRTPGGAGQTPPR